MQGMAVQKGRSQYSEVNGQVEDKGIGKGVSITKVET
jgi:hypothetical protein